MTLVQRFLRIGSALAVSFALVGCGAPSAEQKAPESNDIQQFIKDNPEVLLDEDLDAADDATIE